MSASRGAICVLTAFFAIHGAVAFGGPESIALPELTRGARLDVAPQSSRTGGVDQVAFPAHVCLLLTVNGSSKMLKSVADLSGLVRIDNAESALRYVRLRTAFSTWMLWARRESEIEIVTMDEMHRIPNFGIKAAPAPTDDQPGCLGVLPRKDFASFGFSAATAQVTRGGFTVKRWLLSRSITGSKTVYLVELVSESVSPTGAYTRTVLPQHPAPTASNIKWSFGAGPR